MKCEEGSGVCCVSGSQTFAKLRMKARACFGCPLKLFLTNDAADELKLVAKLTKPASTAEGAVQKSSHQVADCVTSFPPLISRKFRAFGGIWANLGKFEKLLEN